MALSHFDPIRSHSLTQVARGRSCTFEHYVYVPYKIGSLKNSDNVNKAYGVTDSLLLLWSHTCHPADFLNLAIRYRYNI